MLAAFAAAVLDMTPPETVFLSGRLSSGSAFDTYRIPALLRTRRGTLTAMAEGRGSVSDQASNAIVMRRKERGGSWGQEQIVADLRPASLNNPTLLSDSRGRIWMMLQSYPAGKGEYSIGAGYDPATTLSVLLVHSDDDGKTWSKPQDITRQARPEGARTCASGPGVGIELSRGRHRGRLLFPFNQRTGEDWTVYSVFSDDRGRTWQMGDPAPRLPGTQPNEVQFAELADGRVLLNARNQASGKFRLQSVSQDGGATWPAPEPRTDLVDPVCMGSLVRLSFTPDVLLFANPASASGRVQGTLKLSRDGGATWSAAGVIEPGSFAYSSLAPLSPNRVGILYESPERLAGNREGYRLLYREIAVPGL